jgi:hypothetical protein
MSRTATKLQHPQAGWYEEAEIGRILGMKEFGL